MDGLPPSSDQTDAALLRQANHDPASFGVFYGRHSRNLLAWFGRHVPDRQTALELTAETFAQALQHKRRFRDPGDGNAAPWLYGIARNLLKRYQLKSRVETEARRKLGILEETRFASDDTSTSITRIDALRRRPELQGALARLPPSERAAVSLRVVDDLSYAEIGEQLGCSAIAARVRVSRGLHALKNRLKGL